MDDVSKTQEEALLHEAADWFVRLHDDANAKVLADWQAWLDLSEAHRDAFRRIEEMWKLMGQAASH